MLVRVVRSRANPGVISDSVKNESARTKNYGGGGANAPPSLFRVKYVTFIKAIQL